MELERSTYAGYGIPTLPGFKIPAVFIKTHDIIPIIGEIKIQVIPKRDFLYAIKKSLLKSCTTSSLEFMIFVSI
jgi:hypothetical protein